MDYAKRAISNMEKQQREKDIINAAEELFSNADYKDITMAEIAQAAGLAKGTLFIYFRTKEELFLSIAERSMLQWSREIQVKLSEIEASKRVLPVSEFIDILVGSIDSGVFVRLLSILDDTLEQNIDLDRAVKFKTFLKNEMSGIGKLIEAVLPEIREGHGIIVLSQLFICLIGAYKVSNPSPVVKQAIQSPGLEFFDRDFIKTLKEMAACHISGYIAMHQNK